MKDCNCIFCKIANGEIPSSTVYEDEDFRVILDLGPAAKGHALILPKEHFKDVTELDPKIAAKVLPLGAKLGTAMKKSLGCAGFNLVQNNGEAAGQTVFHFHVHVIPRYEGGPVIAGWEPGKEDPEVLAETAMYMKLAYAIGVPYDDVEDIVMEVFWSFYRADYGGKLESEKAIKVMLARIVENKCIDYFRKEKRSIKPNEDEDVSELEYVADLSTYDPLQSVISRESCGQIFEVLDGLRESWKDVTVMYFIQGFTTEEICERLEITNDMCRSRISRARKYLRENLKSRMDRGHL